MRSIRARFTETTTSSLLVKPLVAHGTVIGASPARVRMTYTDPEAKTIAMDGKTLLVAWAGRRERERIDITDMQKRIDQYFTRASTPPPPPVSKLGRSGSGFSPSPTDIKGAQERAG